VIGIPVVGIAGVKNSSADSRNFFFFSNISDRYEGEETTE
jgi:hypothetical protein